MNFSLAKLDKKEMAKKLITLASASWHNAVLSHKDNNILFAKKNIYHAIRILDFGIQIKNNDKIVNYESLNEFKKKLDIRSADFHVKDYFHLFLELSQELKK